MTDLTGRIIVFTLQGNSYSLRLGQVAEVLEGAITFPVPMAPVYLNEAIDFHGEIVPVLDLEALLSSGSKTRGEGLLVLDRKIAVLALKVDSVAGIMPEEDIVEEGAASDPLVEKVYNIAGRRVECLSIEAVLKKLEETLN